MNNHLIVGIAGAFVAGIIVMFCCEYPALTTALNGLNDKNVAIERLEAMVRECKK